MSEGMNYVVLMGHLGADPILRHTQAGQAVLSIRMATTEVYFDKNKERQEITQWHDVTVWGNRAEGLARILVKGSGIVVEGSLRTSSYEKDGVKKYHTEINARDIHLMPSARRDVSESFDDTARAKSNGSSAFADTPF
jgi:single-strand DNA-binding protein